MVVHRRHGCSKVSPSSQLGDLFANGSLSGFLIFATWWWTRYYYIFLPFITVTAALNCIMVFSVIFHTLLHRVVPEKEDIPTSPETMVYILPCYNENKEECMHSLDSLVAQVDIDQHQKAIMIVCDGRVRGPGMEKTTADYLLDDILTNKSSREYIRAAYTGWDHSEMDVVIQKGTFGGIPYLCIIKEQNQGKRDSLIVVRSFLYNFNIRSTQPAVIFSPHFFDVMSSFLTVDATISNVDLLIGMDADTFFAPTCISELLKQSHYKHTVGVCGYVAVAATGTAQWSPWILYQSCEYTISQCLRRLHQSVATHKVSCLPGCCQLLKICEATCGDYVLLELFGYYPTPTDSILKHIRATASEDRNHVCLMLSARPKSRTRQALKALAYTDVPRSWSVFLSQRRRWTLGATVNDFFLMFAPGVNWFERILAIANVMTWFLNPFVIASIAGLVMAYTGKSVLRFHSLDCADEVGAVGKVWLILAFSSVMILPILYYVLITVWQPRGTRGRVQYLMGLFIYVFLGAFLNILVLSYALWNMNNFAWGRTRQVVEEPEAVTEKVTEKGTEQVTVPEPVHAK